MEEKNFVIHFVRKNIIQLKIMLFFVVAIVLVAGANAVHNTTGRY
jgi:hypothetical protein